MELPVPDRSACGLRRGGLGQSVSSLKAHGFLQRGVMVPGAIKGSAHGIAEAGNALFDFALIICTFPNMYFLYQ